MEKSVSLNHDEILKWSHNGTKYCLHCIYDESPENPIQNIEDVHIVSRLNKYNIGNEKGDPLEQEFWMSLVDKYAPEKAGQDRSILECQEILRDKIAWTRLWIYDHSGISLACGDANPYTCQFDSGLVGIVFMEKSAFPESKNWKSVALHRMEEVIEGYDKYLSNDIYEVGALMKTKDGWEGFDSVTNVYDTDIGYLAELFDSEVIGIKAAVESGQYEIKEAVLKKYYDYDA